MVSEPAGLEEARCDVVRQVLESQGGAGEVLAAAVDRVRGDGARAGAVEGTRGCRPRAVSVFDLAADFDERCRDAACERVDDLLHGELLQVTVGFPVGGEQPLVTAPDRLDVGVLLGREKLHQCGLLLVGEEPGSGVEGAVSLVRRVVIPSWPSERVALDAASTLVEPAWDRWRAVLGRDGLVVWRDHAADRSTTDDESIVVFR